MIIEICMQGKPRGGEKKVPNWDDFLIKSDNILDCKKETLVELRAELRREKGKLIVGDLLDLTLSE